MSDTFCAKHPKGQFLAKGTGHLFIARPLVLAVVLSAAQNLAAVAADYHVAQTDIAADSNSGDADHPWRTLSAAAGRVQPGDTVWIDHGDYRSEDSGWGQGVIRQTVSGTATSPIRWIAEKDCKPNVFRFLLQQVQHVHIEGIHFINPKLENVDNHWQDMPHIDRAGLLDSRARERFAQPWDARRGEIEKEFAGYFQRLQALKYETAIELEDCQHISVKNNFIDGYWAGIQCRHGDQILIESNRLTHCVNGIYSWQPAPGLAHSVIRRNFISQSLDNGIDIREQSHHVLIEENHIRYSGRSHIALHNETRDCTIRGNDVRYGGYYSESMEYPGSSAISIHSSLDGIIVERNLAAYQIDLTGIDGNGFILDLMKSGASVHVRDNVAWRNMGSGLNLTASPNARIVHNAFIENGFESPGRRCGAGIKLSRDSDTQLTILNNILSNNRDGGILAYHNLLQQLQIDSNLYYSALDGPLMWDGFEDDERSYKSLAAINTHTGWEKHGQVANPRLRSPEKIDSFADVQLQFDSPAIGAAQIIGEEVDRPKLQTANLGPR